MPSSPLTILRRLAAIGAGAVIIVASLLPQEALDIQANDRILHFLAYAGWAGLVAISPRRARRVGLYLLVIILIGVSIELIQPFFGRQGSLLDGVANLAGVLIGSIIGRLVSPHLHHVTRDDGNQGPVD